MAVLQGHFEGCDDGLRCVGHLAPRESVDRPAKHMNSILLVPVMLEGRAVHVVALTIEFDENLLIRIGEVGAAYDRISVANAVLRSRSRQV